MTNPLGGITLTTYDPAGNTLTTTVESSSANAPNVLTTYSYDADNRVDKTVVGSGSTAATTLQSYDPDGNVFCSVSANAYAKGSSAYQCPQWQVAWITAPPSPTALYSTTPGEPGEQRHDGVLQRGRRRGAEHQPRRRDVHLGLRRRRPGLLHLGPGQPRRPAHG